MSSGQKRIITNTRERLVSTDPNRTQAFIASDRSLLFMAWQNNPRLNYLLNPGVSLLQTAGSVPIRADVYGGLLVDPSLPTSLLVGPGVIGLWAPDPGGTPDDAPYMIINDPGLQTAGVLNFTANASGQPRVDLVECQAIDTLLESDNRDIFNPATGLFTPATVDKVRVWRLTYRIRLGVGGAGCPAPVAAWVPIAAVVVGTAATDFSKCDFYDVRPLIEDRVPFQQPGGANPANYRISSSEFSIRLNAGAWLLAGEALSSYGGYLAGGVLFRGMPSFTGVFGGTGNADGDPPFINLSNNENRENGFAHTADSYNAVCAFFPQNLPRWVRYSQTAIGGGIGRVPRGPRGVVCLIVGDNGSQNGFAARSIPVFGACEGVVLLYGKSNNAGTDFCASNGIDGWQYVSETTNTASAAPVSNVVSFQLGGVTAYPSTAKEIQVELLFAWKNPGFTTAGETDRVQLDMLDVAGVENQKVATFDVIEKDANPNVAHPTVRVPLPARPSPFDFTSETHCFLQATTDLPVVPLVSHALVVGWKI